MQYFSPLLNAILGIRDSFIATLGGTTNSQRVLEFWALQGKLCTGLDYNFFRDKGLLVPWHSLVWDVAITPKHGFILWLAACNRLSTKDNLPFLNDHCCLFCPAQETARHLFFKCPAVKSIWSAIVHWLSMPPDLKCLPIISAWGQRHLKKKGFRNCKISIAANVYFVWQRRNKALTEGMPINIGDVIHRLQTHVFRALNALK